MNAHDDMDEIAFPIDIELAKAAVRRRRVHVDQYERLNDDTLYAIYIAAVFILMKGRVALDAGAKWAHVARLLDEYQLLRMARRVDDPHPFAPILQLVVRLRAIEDTADLRRAEGHLRSIGQALLDAQGCSKVTPNDLINRPLPTVTSVNKLFSWE